MDEQERLEELRRRRDALAASGADDGGERARLDEEVAEAEERSLTGSGAPRTPLEGSQARCYVAALMRHGPAGIDARKLRDDAVAGTRRSLSRIRLALLGARSSGAVLHARVSLPPRRPAPGRRPRRGPARAAPDLPRPAGAA